MTGILRERACRIVPKILEKWSPLCQRIEVAGSFRRNRHSINDLDFVVQIDPALRAEFLELLKESCRVLRGDDTDAQNTIAEIAFGTLEGFQVDLFFAHGGVKDLFSEQPTNWGSLLLCRTGSAQHNIRFANLVKAKGWHWNPYRGIEHGDRIVASDTEQAMYAAVGVEFIEPWLRDDAL